MLSKQGKISFAFIKATEGSTYVDPKFEYNYSNGLKTDLRIGCYHYFSFDSAGKDQAENFIKNVSIADRMLPPVIDLELYGKYKKDPPEPETVRKELSNMIDIIFEHYSLMPIIYVPEDTYNLYIKGFFNDCDIWWRNVYSSKGTPDGRSWTFWQYTNREKLKGYKGNEKHIDMNVFYRSKEEFLNYGIAN